MLYKCSFRSSFDPMTESIPTHAHPGDSFYRFKNTEETDHRRSMVFLCHPKRCICHLQLLKPAPRMSGSRGFLGTDLRSSRRYLVLRWISKVSNSQRVERKKRGQTVILHESAPAGHTSPKVAFVGQRNRDQHHPSD
jgi:hypothetical protein